MTTIVANAKEMCSDSAMSWESAIVLVDDKIETVNRQIVGCAGHVPSIHKFIKWLRNPVDEHPEFEAGDDNSFDALVLNERGLFIYSGSCVPSKMREAYAAIGSGGDAAWGALRCGKSPRIAVEFACERDKNSRLPVQRITLAVALKTKGI